MSFRIHLYSPTGNLPEATIYPQPVWHTNVPDGKYPGICSSENVPNIPNPLYILHIPREALREKIESGYFICDPNKCLFHCMTSSLEKLKL